MVVTVMVVRKSAAASPPVKMTQATSRVTASPDAVRWHTNGKLPYSTQHSAPCTHTHGVQNYSATLTPTARGGLCPSGGRGLTASAEHATAASALHMRSLAVWGTSRSQCCRCMTALDGVAALHDVGGGAQGHGCMTSPAALGSSISRSAVQHRAGVAGDLTQVSGTV